MSAVGPIGTLPLFAPHLNEALPASKAGGAEPVLPFSQFLVDAVSSANAKSIEAQGASEAFAAGARDDIHGTMIAIKEAEIELKLVSNVRNKLVEAWNDMWRMNV
jgi:flagellar hook-basal body complex protein FliE